MTYGPLLLAALTDGERTLRVRTSPAVASDGWSPALDGWLNPVDELARTQLVTISADPDEPSINATMARGLSRDCHGLVAVNNAMAVEESVRKASAAALDRASKCKSDDKPSPEDKACDQEEGGFNLRKPMMVMSHSGIGNRIALVPRPPQPPALSQRRGGSDKVNAATWRLTISIDGVSAVLESYDRPGLVATLGPQEAGGYNRPLLLLPEDPRANPNWRPTDEMGVPTTQPPAQRWRIHPIGGAGLYLYEDGYKEDGHLTALGVKDTRRKDACGGPMLRVALENLEVYPPVWLRKGGKEGLEAAPLAGGTQDVHTFLLRAPLSLYPPLAHWAESNRTCVPMSWRSQDSPAVCSAERTYLMVPMRELLDETYSSHLCVVPPGTRSVPNWCH